MIKQPINVDFDLNAKVSNSKVIAISHVDDKYNEVLEVNVRQNGAHIDLTGANVIARMVLHAEIDYLLNDNVPCTVSDSGNIMIPFDNAVVKTLQGIVKIEVSITRGEDKLTLQFPLWVSVRGSIIESAEVTPESEGTIPDLLKEATEALEDAKEALEHFGSYSDLTDKPQINDVTLSGDQSADDLGLQKKLTAGQNITIENDGTISASDGVTSYNDLTDKPIIKSKSGLEYPIDGKIILPNFYITNYDLTNKTITYGLNLSGNDLYNSSLPFSKFTQQLQREVFKDYGYYENPPADLFTNYSKAPAKNGIWCIGDGTLVGLPVPATGRLINYYCNGERVQIYATDIFLPQDSRYLYGGRYFIRTQRMGDLGTWKEFGGADDYNDLSNKPQIGFSGQSVTLNGALNFYFGDFTGEVLPNGVSISLRENVFKSSLQPSSDILYNFNSIKSNLLYTGVFKIRKVDVTNLPQKFTDAGSTIYVYHYVTTKTYSNLIRMVTYETADGVKVWSQLVELGGMDASDNVQVTAQTAWTDLTNQVGYALTPQDKADIADIVLQSLPTTQGVLYGNTSN